MQHILSKPMISCWHLWQSSRTAFKWLGAASTCISMKSYIKSKHDLDHQHSNTYFSKHTISEELPIYCVYFPNNCPYWHKVNETASLESYTMGIYSLAGIQACHNNTEYRPYTSGSMSISLHTQSNLKLTKRFVNFFTFNNNEMHKMV